MTEFDNKKTINGVDPLIAWVGGKRKELKYIKKHMPVEFDRYCEPFFGGGATYFMLGIDKPSIINDYNSTLTNFYREVQKGNGKKIASFLELFPNSKLTFNIVKNTQPKCNLSSARHFAYLLYNTWGAVWKTDKQKKFNGSFGNKKKGTEPLIKRLLTDTYKKKLANAIIENKDYREIMHMKKDDKNCFMFLDPPYHNTLGYTCPFGEKQQRQLASMFKEVKCKCLLIINKTPLTEELYKDYIVEEYAKRYDMQGCPLAKHIIVKNY